MKNLIYFVVFTIAGLTIYSFMNPKANFKVDNTGSIQFHRGSWNEAMTEAEKEHKLIFLDIYTTWCGPCKRLKATTFANSRVGKYFNENFINVSLDGETGDGLILANQYNITGYPTLLFINKDGKVVASADGYLDAGELLQLGKSVIK